MTSKVISRAFIVLGVTAVILTVPLPTTGISETRAPVGSAFVWAQDSLWASLERQFVLAREHPCDQVEAKAGTRLSHLEAHAERLRDSPLASSDPTLDSLEAGLFAVSTLAAACPEVMPRLLSLYGLSREGVKLRSRQWDMASEDVRDRLYRLLYGGRAAVEEVILQHPEMSVSVVDGHSEPSATPSAVVHGVTIHSGDILVSRGGYPTSALIARGSDYPGNFSHVALAYVDGSSGEAYTIESHIEIGVAVSTAEQYLADKKLRIMVLRPRADLAVMEADPLLPHKAARAMLQRAQSGHIAYDFAMDYTDPSRLFCSEVASAAYADFGLDLWMGISRISNPGLRRWLSAFGVKHFETQEPSDLEYDPQLSVVAEWRDPAALYRDHVDNAVTDAMLEGAERGDRLEYDWYKLAPARVMKAYSWLLERFGKVGPVPEGMSAAAALRNRWYSDRHGALAEAVAVRAASFNRSRGYVAPYWQLVEMARDAMRDVEHGTEDRAAAAVR